MEDLVLKLREARQLSGLSQKEAAEKSGVGEKTISSFETGARIDSLKLSQLYALLDAYGMTPKKFFGGEFDVFLEEETKPILPEAAKLSRELRELSPPTREAVMHRFKDILSGINIR